MSRKFFNFVSVLSLLLCVASVVLWVRSYWVQEEWSVTAHRKLVVRSEGGRILLLRFRVFSYDATLPAKSRSTMVVPPEPEYVPPFPAPDMPGEQPLSAFRIWAHDHVWPVLPDFPQHFGSLAWGTHDDSVANVFDSTVTSGPQGIVVLNYRAHIKGTLIEAFLIPHWLPFLLSFPLAALLSVRGVRAVWRRLRFEDGLCRTCGYDLTGNTSGVCPECGTAVAGKAGA